MLPLDENVSHVAMQPAWQAVEGEGKGEMSAGGSSANCDVNLTHPSLICLATLTIPLQN